MLIRKLRPRNGVWRKGERKISAQEHIDRVSPGSHLRKDLEDVIA